MFIRILKYSIFRVVLGDPFLFVFLFKKEKEFQCRQIRIQCDLK